MDLSIKMKKLTNLYFTALLIFSVLIANMALSFAQENFIEEEVTSTDEVVEEPVLTDEELEKIEENKRFLDKLRQELIYTKSDYQQLLTNIVDTKYQLDAIVKEKITLAIQIRNLDSLIVTTTEKLLKVIEQVVQTENEIELLYEEIQMKEISFEYQKQLLKDYIAVLYREENKYFSIDENGDLETYKLLLSDNSVSDILTEIKYFDLLNNSGLEILDKLDGLQKGLILEKQKLNIKRRELTELQEEIFNEKKQLELQKLAKENLLELTMGQEDIYSQLLKQSFEQQESVVGEIKSLNNAVSFIEEQIEIQGLDFNPNNYESLLTPRGKALYDFHLRYRGFGEADFDWPVDPIKGISAYFRDPGYAGVFGVRHNAVDIPAYQGSPVRAASDGVVYSSRDNGYGYSYIILVHSNGLSSVYGHISQLLVEEGQIVAQGSIIGLSGGMPGTKGAGYMTTGPHLHFEIHYNGDYVDPLDYLPLKILTEDQMEWLPEKYKDAWEIENFGRTLDAIQRVDS